MSCLIFLAGMVSWRNANTVRISLSVFKSHLAGLSLHLLPVHSAGCFDIIQPRRFDIKHCPHHRSHIFFFFKILLFNKLESFWNGARLAITRNYRTRLYEITRDCTRLLEIVRECTVLWKIWGPYSPYRLIFFTTYVNLRFFFISRVSKKFLHSLYLRKVFQRNENLFLR